MGDFDKQQNSDAAAEKKKLVVVGLLGAVLLGIVVIHFTKTGPQSASASVFSSGSDSLVGENMDETPAQAQAALANDPTATLLRGSKSAGNSAQEKLPHNPFVMSPDWRTTLVHPTEVHQPVYTAQPTVYAPAPQTINLQSFKLSGILQQRDKTLCAIINGQMVSAGMTVNDAKVVDITANRVTLQRADSPSGPKADLTLDSKY
jgi:hypothetical protein